MILFSRSCQERALMTSEFWLTLIPFVANLMDSYQIGAHLWRLFRPSQPATAPSYTFNSCQFIGDDWQPAPQVPAVPAPTAHPTPADSRPASPQAVDGIEVALVLVVVLHLPAGTPELVTSCSPGREAKAGNRHDGDSAVQWCSGARFEVGDRAVLVTGVDAVVGFGGDGPGGGWQGNGQRLEIETPQSSRVREWTIW